MSDSTQNGRKTRRQFLDWLLRSAGAVWLASVVYPVLRYLRPLHSQGAGGPIPIPPDKLAEAEGKDRFAILRAAGTRLIVLDDPQNKLRAFSAVCTHEGCTVQYQPGEHIIWCACHNGKYGLDGHVISGPPPKPLPEYAITKDAKGDFFVKMDEA